MSINLRAVLHVIRAGGLGARDSAHICNLLNVTATESLSIKWDEIMGKVSLIFISLFYARVAAVLSFTGLQIIGRNFVEGVRIGMNLYSSPRQQLNMI